MNFWVGIHAGGLTGRIIGQRTRDPPSGGRSSINGMTVDSHRRMLSWLLDVRWEGLQAHFVTLTYADTGDLGSPQSWHAQLQAFWKARKREGAQGMIWKMEMAKRRSGILLGALRPHWHLLVIGHPWQTEVLGGVCHEHWSKIQKQETRTQVVLYQEEAGRRAALCYLGKYMSKVTASDEHPATGRVWGFVGVVPRVAPSFIAIDPGEWPYLIARVRLEGSGSDEGGGSAFIKNLSPWQSAWTLIGGSESLLDGLKIRNAEDDHEDHSNCTSGQGGAEDGAMAGAPEG